MRFSLLFLLPAAALAQPVIFLEPAQKVDTNSAEIRQGNPLYRQVDGAKYLAWLENPPARRALHLYETAYGILTQKGNPQKQPEAYYIALVPGGNHAAVGFRVQTEKGIEEHPKQAYILLEPAPDAFQDTLIHETGHVVMEMLAGGKQLDAADVCSIPHTTAALTDRATAFSEGWAIHLETLTAHLAPDAATRAKYFHERVQFGDGLYHNIEFFRHAADLTSYSQSIARYTDVRDNNFAFGSAYHGPDYLRVQLEKARDFAQLRDADQLLQSEGFYASFFFLYLMRGETRPAEAEIEARHERMLKAMSAMFDAVQAKQDTPWLPMFVLSYIQLFPEEKQSILDALNDLSHGVFVDSSAGTLWREHYLAALRLDIPRLKSEALPAARKRWREQVNANPKVLLAGLGPQIPCEIKAVSIKVEAFGEASPLLFDVNTAPEPILRMVPGLTDEQVTAWRKLRPFPDLATFEKATGVHACGH
jgi:hypothetical protein